MSSYVGSIKFHCETNRWWHVVEKKDSYKLAIDVGTSQISARLLTCSNDSFSIFSIPNSLLKYGQEIVSLIRCSFNNAEKLRELTNSLRSTINLLIQKTLDSHNISVEQILRITVVGNTVMHHVLLGYSLDGLASFPYHPTETRSIWTSGSQIGLETISDVQVFCPRIMEAFVGSDAISMIVSSKQNESKTKLLLDIGTNSEIVLKHEDSYLVTSAPSGPAFEGMSIKCGMAAQPGAITAVEIDESYKPNTLVLGRLLPSGICGSGTISLLSEMLRTGIINENGSIQRNLDLPYLHEHNSIFSYTIVEKDDSATGERIYISQPDIRMLQQSKAAIFGAIMTLFDRVDISPGDVNHLYLTGSFGANLDIESATSIGLFPNLVQACHRKVGHGALEGAGILSCLQDPDEEISEICSRTEYVPLDSNPIFDQYYLQGHRFSEF
ncbi:MAG: DUF4445 domain-containing protein [Candidatus Lokiarchaeota archaeon]|nr:DUF4445 domain-containing protein [Candidatus Lokiarchaeota archaeon]